MFSSNSFNVCPHCGKANSLNARYCSSCGKQLVTPQEVVVCHRCHKTNSPLASFCGACGAPLRIGAKTKICPKCHREIDISANVCSCGYDFTPVQYTAPVKKRQEQPAPVKEQEKPAKPQKEAAATAAKPLYRHKGGRAIAVVVLILVLLFAFLILTPYYRVGDEGIMMGEDDKPLTIRFGFLAKFDKGLIFLGEGESLYPYYGVDLIQTLLYPFTHADALGEMSAIQFLQQYLGTGGLAIVAMVVLFVLAALVQLIVCIVRIIRGKRSIHVNYFYLALASLTLLWSLLAFFLGMFVDPDGEGFLVTLRTIFVPGANGAQEFGFGYVTFLIPLFFGLMFFFSLFGRARKVKEKVA